VQKELKSILLNPFTRSRQP